MMKIITIIMLLCMSSAVFAQCDTGLNFFAGVGYDNGPHNHTLTGDLAGTRYRDEKQGIYGIEWNYKHLRLQYIHSSSLDNYDGQSYGDLNMFSIQGQISLKKILSWF